MLHLEKEDGSWQVARDDDIVARFAAIGDLPHLVFLVACESAARDAASAGGEDAFVGLGPKLVQAGFPAVVAMQAQVPVLTARQVAGEFYRRLMEHGQVDKAMSQARNLAFKPDRVDWGIPVLFMRLRAGQLFNVGELPKIEIENRSLEAAMPQAVRVKQRTEVRVMVAAAGSAGLRAHLPAFTESRELIDKTDVQASTVPVEFPTDPATNRPAPVELKASLTAPGFEIEQPLVRLRVPPKADSGVATFFLTAGTRQPLARVKVELRSANNDAYLGSTTLTTEVKDWQDDVAKVIWSLVTLPIGLAMVTKPEGEKPMLPEEKPHQGGINISTGAGEGGVTFGNVGGSINIGGQVVGRDAISTTTITNVTESAPASREANPWFIFETQMKKARKSVADLSLDDADKDELDELIRKVEAEVKKGEGADLRRLERWLGNIGDVSKEALAAVVRVLTNVAAKVPEPVRAIAEKTGG